MKYTDIKKKFIKDGYAIISLPHILKKIDTINKKIDGIIINKNFKTNPKSFHYNKSPRIVESWKKISEVRNIAYDKELLRILRILKKNKEPIPFSTINFLKGTEQPMHSDYIHFATLPENYLVGVWIALEDINKDAGPLAIINASHKFPVLTNEKLNLNIPSSEKELKKNYTIYENHIKKTIKIKKAKVKEIPIKKGELIIWDANLLHGGLKIKNKNLTRKSLVYHYHFEGCKKYFNPIYSFPSKGIFAERDLKKLKINKR